MDKYLLAVNPMTDNGDLAIVRTVQPVQIWQVLEGRRETKQRFTKTYAHKGEEFTLVLHHWFSPDFDNQSDSVVWKGMDDAYHWYRAYIDWADENYGEE